MLLGLLLSLLIFVLMIFSLILNIRDWRWRTDIETDKGQLKLAKIAYERLELSRWRVSHWNNFLQKSEYLKVRLDAPAELVSHLRVFGIKDGESHLVFVTYYTPDRLKAIQKIVDEYNDRRK